MSNQSSRASRASRAPVVVVVEEFAREPAAVSQWLEASGYRVVREQSMQDAMEDAVDYTCRERPDLILLNLRALLPEDLSAMRQLREGGAFREVPIVGLSESGEQGYRAVVFAIGGGELVTRLVAAEKLPGLLAELLARPRAAGEGGRV